MRKSEPRGQVKCASPAAVSSSASARPRRCSSPMSAVISRASRSAVTPGSVAPRAPLSVAALRARVCDSERLVGAMNTSAAASAAATAAGGSCPFTSRASITASTASAPARDASARSASPISRVPSSTTTRTSSPSRTPRHCPMTLRTAGSRSLMAMILSGETMVARAH
jgi:hypothetical protein